jgi:hypothetical protein
VYFGVKYSNAINEGVGESLLELVEDLNARGISSDIISCTDDPPLIELIQCLHTLCNVTVFLRVKYSNAINEGVGGRELEWLVEHTQGTKVRRKKVRRK